MLDENPLLTIRRNFRRPDADAVAALTGVPTGFLVDCMEGKGALDYRIKPLLPDRATFAGVALTCHCGPADNLALAAALTMVQPGDVLVAATDGYMGAAVTGDLVLGMAKNAGAVALVSDGLARDLSGIRDVGLPIFCRGLTPNSPDRNGPGTIGLPVVLDSVPIDAGDVVVGDEDGVVVVPHARIGDVLARLPATQAAEETATKNVADGQTVPGYVTDELLSKCLEIE